MLVFGHHNTTKQAPPTLSLSLSPSLWTLFLFSLSPLPTTSSLYLSLSSSSPSNNHSLSLTQTMEDPNNPTTQTPDRSSEPVRSRWTPKPEQILILESIFNSGMVNPPKDETVRIRKLLEKFGSVGDANVFYWFQNRRSRSRRRQRQIQAAAAATNSAASSASSVVEPTYAVNQPVMVDGGGGFDCYGSSTYNHEMLGMNYSSLGADDLFSISRQMGLGEIDRSSSLMSSVVDASPSCSVNLQQQPGFITVFINGVPSEVPRGPIDMTALFGRDVILVHSSGEIVPTNENGVILQSLLLGESYFLVSKPS